MKEEPFCAYEKLGDYIEYPNLVVLRTFSKAFGLAGLRLGYAHFVEKVCENALRAKKGPRAKQGTDIIAGIELLKSEEYAHAARFLKPYSHLDATLGAAVAYCYYMISMKELASLKAKVKDFNEKEQLPNKYELMAREEMLRLANSRPPVNALREIRFREEEEPLLRRAFWLMISCSLESLKVPEARDLILNPNVQAAALAHAI
jgi:hypothetical protein